MKKTLICIAATLLLTTVSGHADPIPESSTIKEDAGWYSNVSRLICPETCKASLVGSVAEHELPFHEKLNYVCKVKGRYGRQQDRSPICQFVGADGTVQKSGTFDCLCVKQPQPPPI